MFSATRQWNPGDEFILSGARRIIDTAIGPVEPLLYDRNPDVRPSDGSTVGYRNIRRPVDEVAGEVYEKLASRLRLGFFSNSVKFDSDLSYASLAVLAGSPEWATPRMWSFYDHVFRNRLPLIGLGVGSMPDKLPSFMHSALQNAALLTTRSKSLATSELAKRYGIDYLPCPALLSAPASRHVTQVHRVAVVLGVPYSDAVWANGLDQGFYDQVCDALDRLIARVGNEIDIDFVAHYIDELPVLRSRFPNHDVRYSFDSAEYYDIFAGYDLVISTRVHGCGAASSLGIPSISLGHDFRSDTTEGFLSVSVDVTNSTDGLDSAFDELTARISDASASLNRHRTATLDAYVDRVRDTFANGIEPVDYGASGSVTFAEEQVLELWDAERVGSSIEDLVPVVQQLNEVQAVLHEVEASKAEIAAELDGARAAVARLEAIVAEQADELAQRPTGVMSALKQRVRRGFDS